MKVISRLCGALRCGSDSSPVNIAREFALGIPDAVPASATITNMKLADYSDLARTHREAGLGHERFRDLPIVSLLLWPDDVVEQWLYDHADNDCFLDDYGDIDLTCVGWKRELIPVVELTDIPTGPSDGDCMEEYAANPDHWVRVRNSGIHEGVAESWEICGTWKREPVLIDRLLLATPVHGLQVVEGRTRIGVLRGRYRSDNASVAEVHSVWVGRQR